MSKKIRIAFVLALLGVFAATLTVYAGGHRSSADVFVIATDEVVGESTLTRTPNGVSMTLKTNLTPGDADTIWWVVFNNRAACATSPCGEADLFTPAVQADVLYAAGNVTGGSGKSTFAAYLAEGDTSGSIASLFVLPAAQGLIDSETAEIHLVVRTHGQMIPSEVASQIHSFNGGCPLPNTCTDIQASIHLP